MDRREISEAAWMGIGDVVTDLVGGPAGLDVSALAC